MAQPEGRIEMVRLHAGAVPDIVEVFAEAFRDYPVMRFVLPEDDDYTARLESLIHFFVSARSLRGEPLVGVVENGRLAAAATISYPTDTGGPPALATLRDATWARLGAEARARYEACGEVWRTFTAPEPHIHLNMIGVRRAAQGRGHGRQLLEYVHQFSRDTPGSQGVTLTTEDPQNVGFYQLAGYEVTGHARVSPQLETWGFFRRTSMT